MPGKGGKKSRVKCRKKAERNKKILSKKSNKRKERQHTRLDVLPGGRTTQYEISIKYCGATPRNFELNWLKRHLKKNEGGGIE